MNFRREIVKKCIAQMCINLGWESTTSTALDTLTNVLENYFFAVAHNTHLASELKGDPELSFQDICMSFDKLDINLTDLSDYIMLADHSQLPMSVPYFPASRHKIATQSEQKTSSGRDNQISADKKQQGNECITPIKNTKVIPEEAEASQYEMKCFSQIENLELFSDVRGCTPSSKINKSLPIEASKFSKTKSLNASKPFIDVRKEKIDQTQGKQNKFITDCLDDRAERSYCKTQSPKKPIICPKTHRKATIKEVCIAKKKQSKSAKLASSMVKVDMSDTNFEIKKKRPGRKPKKVPKSRSVVMDSDETNVIPQIPIDEMPSGDTERVGDSLLEVVNTVVEETLDEENDAMLEDDLELGAVNDEMLVEIADRGGDSPLSHLTGIPIQNRELFNNSDLFGNALALKEGGNSIIDPHVNIDVEEEVLPWSDDEKPKTDKTNVHKATGLELILRSQGDGSSIGSTSFISPEKLQQSNSFQCVDNDKKKYKKPKKLKKSQKQEKIIKSKKNKPDLVKEEPVVLIVEETPLEETKIIPSDKNDKYLLIDPKSDRPDESFKNNCDVAAGRVSESSDYNDSELDVLNNKKTTQSLPKADYIKHAQDNSAEFKEVTHKKKKKKGKRKLEDPDEMSKSKKFKKENQEMVIPKLTLKFGGATVCGGDTNSPSIHREHGGDHLSKHSLPGPIKLVIKPFTSTHRGHQNRHNRSPNELVNFSPNLSPHQRSPDRLSIPSVALSSRSPSPNDIARLASGPSNRKNLSPIYSESPSPPHEGSSASKVVNLSKHSHPNRQKIKEPKSAPVKSSPINKGPLNKTSKSAVISETVGKITKANGEIIWICPTCGSPDNGTPMIGCDRCDDWYHWICVNIVKEPPAEMNWYCVRCLTQNPSLKSQMPGKRGRPAGKGKSKK